MGDIIIKRRAAVGEERRGHEGSVGVGRAGCPMKGFYWGDWVGLCGLPEGRMRGAGARQNFEREDGPEPLTLTFR